MEHTENKTPTRDSIINQALKTIEGCNGTVAIGTGVGKTRLCLLDANKHYGDKLFLVVGPKLIIKQIWEKEILKWNFKNINFEFVTYVSLNKINMKKYAGVYFDECHNILPSHINFLNSFKKRMVGITGSPPVYEKGIKYKIINQYLPIKFKYLANDAMNDRLLNKCEFIVHLLDLSERKFFVKTKNTGKHFPTTEIKAYKYWSDKILNALDNEDYTKVKKLRLMRMKSIEKFPTKMYYVKHLILKLNQKSIIFVPLQEQADFISTHSYHTKNPNSAINLKLFNEDKINILTCVNQLSEGVNINNLKHGIITQCYSNPTKTIQKIGRLLRLNPDKISEIHILCFANTIDEDWVKEALKLYKDQKIKFIKVKYF